MCGFLRRGSAGLKEPVGLVFSEEGEMVWDYTGRERPNWESFIGLGKKYWLYS